MSNEYAVVCDFANVTRRMIVKLTVRAAVGMGIPMGIPMGMGMVWVWGL